MGMGGSLGAEVVSHTSITLQWEQTSKCSGNGVCDEDHNKAVLTVLGEQGEIYSALGNSRRFHRDDF